MKPLALCFLLCLFSALARGQGTTLNGPVTILPAVGQSPTSTISFTSATDALPCVPVVPPSVADPSLCFDSSGNLTVDIGGGPVILGQKGDPGVNGINGVNGKDGKDGKDGDPGQSATVSIGAVTTLASGSQATVTNVGSSSAAILNFGVPQGIQGAAGKMPSSCTVTMNWNNQQKTRGTATFSGCK